MGRRADIEELIRSTVQTMGFELWGVEYFPQGRNGLLRVYIDRESGVNVDDCVSVSRQLSGLLDVEDPITHAYTLEVSSPGMDRPLYTFIQYQQFLGSLVHIRLKRPFENRKNYKGQIIKTENDEVSILIDDHELMFPMESIERANIIPVFEQDVRGGQ